MDIADEIAKLNKLYQSGTLTDSEYQKAKSSLLLRAEPVSARVGKAVTEVSSSINTWGMLIHLSQYCGFIIPVAGLVVPVLLWTAKKDSSPLIDKHGKAVVNWIITEILLGVLFFVLSFILIGLPLLIGLLVAGFVFPVIGAVKASNGKSWVYPGSIPFIR